MRTLIVDDEPHTVQTLRRLCEEDENADEAVVAECAAMTTGIEMVQESGDLELRSAQETIAPDNTHARRARAARGRPPARLVAEHSRRLYFIAVEDVDYIESCGNYVVIHVGTQKYLRRDTVKRLAAELRDEGFEWIRRSTLINIARVSFAKKLEHGALAFTLACGVRLVSRSRLKLEGMRRTVEDSGP